MIYSGAYALASPMQELNRAPKTGRYVEEQAELQALLASKVFARAPLLSRMLAYLCEQHFQDRADSIKEYSVATNALGRGADFDSEADTIVRVMASRLRSRLVEYYATEGSTHRVKIYLAESGYNPVFVVEPHAEAGRMSSPEPFSPPRRYGQWLTPFLGLLCVALAGSTLWFAHRSGSSDQPSLAGKGPNVKALWSQIVRPGQPADIVVSDSSFVLYQNLTGQTLSLTDYITRRYLGALEKSEMDARRRADLRTLLARRYTSAGEVRLIVMILPLAGGVNPGLRTVFARDYSADSMQRDNVVLLGTSHSNPWVSSYENDLNFLFESTPTSDTTVVRNLKPNAGEQSLYPVELIEGGTSHGYAIAAFLSNLGRTGHVLMLSGSESEGTEAAGQFVTNEESLQRLRKLLPKNSAQVFPHFEVLLRTTRMSGTPGGAEIVAVRAHP